MEEERKVSRRDVLKRIGAGALVAWTAPIVTSIGARAFASRPARKACEDKTCGPDPCFDQSVCASPQSGCTCLATTDGPCYCHQGSSCDALTPCTNRHECPPGWACAASCCEGTLCVPPCGTFVAALPGRRTTG
jgi:hypothetical protein